MKKVCAVCLCLVMGLTLWACAAGEAPKAPDYILEGFDGDNSNHEWETNLFFARMEERTGISFQFRQIKDYTQWEERKRAILAGEDLPDVLFKAGLTPADTEQMYTAGIIMDLKPYLEAYAPDLWALLHEHEEWMEAVTMPDGSIPALPGINELPNNDVPWINTVWLDRVKMDVPTTAEELTEVLRAFRDNDPNRNNRADEVPLTFIGFWELRFLGHAFGIVDNDYYVSVEDGRVVSHLTAAENRTFLEWLHLLWEERLIDRHGFNNSDTLRQITDEKAAIPYGVMLSTTPLSVVPGAALEQYAVMDPLTWKGKQVYRNLLGEMTRGAFALTKNCPEPEKMIAWVNTLYTEEGSRLALNGLEDVDYRWNEDGTWEWVNDVNTVANVTLPQATIGEGGTIPGMIRADFQLKYAEKQTRTMVEQLHGFLEKCVNPYPLVFLSREDRDRIAQLQAGIAAYADQTMTSFVTGDLALNDATWAEFTTRLGQLGLDEMVSIWQKYIH